MSLDLTTILRDMIDRKASDIFVVAGLPLSYKVSGQQQRTDSAPLMPDDTLDLLRQVYALARRDFDHFAQNYNHDEDFSFSIAGLGRFRANAFRQRGSYGMVVRVIPFGHAHRKTL